VSLSDDLREELAAIAPRSECDALAELSGLFHTAGSVHLRGRGEVAVHLDVASPAAARRAFSLYEAGILTRTLAPLEHPPRRVVSRSCCRSAYVRGALLGGGSLTGPRAPHLEVRFASAAGAEFVADLVRRDAARLAVVDRGRHAVAYAKGLDAIADVLAVAGAGHTVLAFEEAAVLAATRARANRLANADHANLVRTSHAAHRQLRAIEELRLSGTLQTLPPPLQEIAELRRRHPTLSLRELAQRCERPATKAAAHRRLRELQRLAGV
jgi:cell division protein WhiA